MKKLIFALGLAIFFTVGCGPGGMVSKAQSQEVCHTTADSLSKIPSFFPGAVFVKMDERQSAELMRRIYEKYPQPQTEYKVDNLIIIHLKEKVYILMYSGDCYKDRLWVPTESFIELIGEGI